MTEQHLIRLLMRLGVAAVLASFMVRSGAFKRMLMREERTLNQRLLLALAFAGIFGTGVATRVLTGSYQAVDLGLEACLLAGIMAGYVTGLVSGVLISIPAMVSGEYLTMPLLAAVGVLGGLLRDCAPDTEDIWRFSPLIDLSIYRLFQRGHDHRRTAFHLFFLLAVILAELLREALGRFFPGSVFCLHPEWPAPHPLWIVMVYVTTLFAVALPLKVWNNARNEAKLVEQEQLLMKARLAALTSQINPHFLFNTLNSVSSLIRTQPEQARAMVYRLSNILRRLLRKHDNFCPLREELTFIEDYLSIEIARFGDKLRFEKSISAETLDMLVPSMLLQPLVENSIRHGLSGKLEGGTIRIRSETGGGRIRVAVEDDGVGIPEARLATLLEKGIGVSNVNERLKVLFGTSYRLYVDSRPEGGTRIEIEIPVLEASLPPAAQAAPTAAR